MNRAVLSAALAAVSLILISCGGGGPSVSKPPSGITTRVLASQSDSSPTASPGLIIVDGEIDVLARTPEISAGRSPTLMAISPDRSTLIAYDSISNGIDVVNTQKETQIASIALPGPVNSPVTSMVAVTASTGYAAVPAAILTGYSPGAVVALNLQQGSISDTINVPNAQTVVANPAGTELLVFPADDTAGTVTVVSPQLVNTNVPVTTVVSGFDYPVYAVFSADGNTAYVLNCGPQCGSTTPSASVQPLDMATLTPGARIPVDGATVGLLNNSTLYVAGISPTNDACTGETTAATVCGRLDIINLGTMTVTSSAVITDGYHDRIDLSDNSQLFIGSHTCTTIGNVNNPSGEVRGCLSIYNTQNGAVVIPPDNGDVTGLQNFTTRDVEYVAEGGNLRVYDTLFDSLLLNDYISTGTITVPGTIVDVKAIDFF